MFGNVVMEVDHGNFEAVIESVKEKKNITEDTEMDAEGWKEVISLYKEKIKEKPAESFQDPKEQLLMAVEAVFKSWNNQRAKVYRRINKIPDDLGTAVNVRPWYLVIKATIQEPESHLPEPLQEKIKFTVSS